MTGVDWLIVGVVVLLALMGLGQGFVAGALSLVGFVAGAWLGSRLVPVLLPDGARSPYAPMFALGGALFACGILAASLEGVGATLRARLMPRLLRPIDGLLGAGLSACLALVLVWMAGAVALHAGSSSLKRDVQRSSILRALNTVASPSGSFLNALARFDPFPRIAGPSARVPPPDRAILRRPGVAGARPGVVRVLGQACGLGIEGSGWVAGPDLVVTNAHVVAGVSAPTVEGRRATPVGFDSRDDVAVLRVPGLGRRPLALAASPRDGTPGAILGFPRDGPFDARPARLGATQDVVTQDAYGRGPVRRSVVALRGLVRPGNSGGPVVDERGRVLATVFAATTSGTHGGYGVPDAVVRGDLARARGPVSTGPCAR